MRPIARYGFLGNVRKLLSQAAFFIDAKESGMGQTATNLGTAGSVLDAQYGSTTGADTNDPLLLEHTGTNYLYLPGGSTSENFASTPAAVGSPLDITGDIAIAVHVDRELPNEDRSLVIRRQNGVDAALVPYVFGIWNAAGGSLKFVWVDASGVTFATYGTVAVPRSIQHVGVTHVVDNGAGQNVVSFFGSTDGVTWSLIQSITNAGTTNHRSNAAQVGIGGSNTGTWGAVGSYYRARVWNAASFTGAPVFDADFTTGITSGGQTTFTESSSNAATVTINRSTSGRKSVAVVRDVWLFGTDDYMEVPDNDLLDFGASDSFTVVAVVRQWNNVPSSATYLAKKANLSTLAGYSLFGTSAPIIGFLIADGTNNPSRSAAPTSGALTSLAGVRDTIADTLVAYLNTTATATTTDTTTATLANSEALRIGRLSGVGGNYGDFELLAVAVFRRALSADEIASIANYYGAS